MIYRICYHGTSSENAKSILETGFRKDTWFATGLQDALGYGGMHVFGVAFKFDEAPNWQFTCAEPIPVDRIVFYNVYEVEKLLYNKELGEEIFNWNIENGEEK